MGKDYAKLTKKVVTDKRGKQKTVWVKVGAEKPKSESKKPTGTPTEMAEFHRKQMKIAQDKNEGHKYHYHMGKRDMYKKQAEAASKKE